MTEIEKIQSDLGDAMLKSLSPEVAWVTYRFEPQVDGGSTSKTSTRDKLGARIWPGWGNDVRDDIANKLHAFMRDANGRSWKVMLFEIDVEKGTFHAEFDYDDASRWDDPKQRAFNEEVRRGVERDNAAGLVGEDRMTDEERDELERHADKGR